MRQARTAFGKVVHRPVKWDLFRREASLLRSLARVVGCLWATPLSCIRVLGRGSSSHTQGGLLKRAIEG